MCSLFSSSFFFLLVLLVFSCRSSSCSPRLTSSSSTLFRFSSLLFLLFSSSFFSLFFSSLSPPPPSADLVSAEMEERGATPEALWASAAELRNLTGRARSAHEPLQPGDDGGVDPVPAERHRWMAAQRSVMPGTTFHLPQCRYANRWIEARSIVESMKISELLTSI